MALGGCGGGSGESLLPEPPSAATGGFHAELRTVDVGGTPITWYERGTGPPLVMLIGTGSTMAEWDPALLRLLAADRRLILLDYPGVGLSGPWRGDSFSSLAATVAEFIEAIGLERASVLGWSMGGFVAQRLAIEHPERVDRLILAGTNPGGPGAVLGTRRAQRIDSDPDPSDRQILSLLYPPEQRTEGRRFLRRLIRASRSGEIPDDFAVPAATVEAQVGAEDGWLRNGDNYRQLAELSIPALIATGRGDPVTPPVNARRIAARIPGSELLILPGRHAFLFQSRARFAQALEAFLAD